MPCIVSQYPTPIPVSVSDKANAAYQASWPQNASSRKARVCAGDSAGARSASVRFCDRLRELGSEHHRLASDYDALHGEHRALLATLNVNVMGNSTSERVTASSHLSSNGSRLVGRRIMSPVSSTQVSLLDASDIYIEGLDASSVNCLVPSTSPHRQDSVRKDVRISQTTSLLTDASSGCSAPKWDHSDPDARVSGRSMHSSWSGDGHQWAPASTPQWAPEKSIEKKLAFSIEKEDSASAGSTTSCPGTPTWQSDSALGTRKFRDSVVNFSLFPVWFDPAGCGHESNFQQTTTAKQRMMLRRQGKSGTFDMNNSDDQSKQERSERDRCVLEPVGRLRLLWDITAFFLLLFELWVTPFELIFLPDQGLPSWMDIVTHLVTLFFAVDIFLNFSTGFIAKNKTIMQRRIIVKRYLQCWFWVDLLATVPWALIFEKMVEDSEFTDGMSALRAGKASKALKTLRYLKYLKVIRTLRLLSSVNKASIWQRHFAKIGRRAGVVVAMAQALAVLTGLAHCNGCIWALAHNTWSKSENSSEAWGKYCESLWWAYVALGVGELKRRCSEFHEFSCSYNAALLRTLDVFVVLQRLCLISVAFKKAALQVHRESINFKDALQTENALQYLRRHNVSFNTQLEVVHSLQETGQAHNLQRHFSELMANDLPLQLRRAICEEVWVKRLLSLGLLMHIAHWDDDFITELALMVREEAFPSKATMFRESDAAIAAYMVLQGTVRLSSSFAIDRIPDILAGMWLGEKALVNPLLRRGASAITRTVTMVMCVPADEFQELLSRLGLFEMFQEFCADRIWQGLCGRCGVLGDHFPDNCPLLKTGKRGSTDFADTPSANHKVRPFISLDPQIEAVPTAGRHPPSPSSARQETYVQRIFSRFLGNRESYIVTSPGGDLVKYLKHHELEFLAPHLDQQSIETLDDLERRGTQMLRESLNENSELDLTEKQWRLLSREAVRKFRDRHAKATHQALFSNHASTQHLIFISHSKVEAGTEAALMRTELINAICEDSGNPGNQLDVPVFLDSEDLTILSDVQERVRKSHNLVILLTESTLYRPWILVEIVTALKEGLRVLPVKVAKLGVNEFQLPDQRYYSRLVSGRIFDDAGRSVMKDADIELSQAADALRIVFQRIIVPYSPHRSETIRQAEILSVLRQCDLKKQNHPRAAFNKTPSFSLTHGDESM